MDFLGLFCPLPPPGCPHCPAPPPPLPLAPAGRTVAWRHVHRAQHSGNGAGARRAVVVLSEQRRVLCRAQSRHLRCAAEWGEAKGRCCGRPVRGVYRGLVSL